MLFRADLHCHSSCSDGSFSPEQLVSLVVEARLSGFSITDHDTIDAYDTVLPVAEGAGVSIVSGVELSASHRGHSVHVLGYAFSLSSSVMRDFCLRHRQRRTARVRAMLELLAREGIDIDEEEVLVSGAPGRPHVGQALVVRGYAKDLRDVFGKYLREGKRGYVPGDAPSVEETIDVIRRSGGLAVLAHPMLIQRRRIVRDLLEMDFDGLEGYYARFPLQQEQRWLDIAEDKGWLVTGGSDFHGELKPINPLGRSWVCRETFEVLLSHFKEVSAGE